MPDMTSNWQPSASIDNLRARAGIIKSIRDFFAARDVLEVETPVICHTSVTDPFIQSIPVLVQPHPQQQEQRYYLQTSPEYAMKRLLAAGSGSIYQITKAFRQEEIGRLHNPEFTILEWYRLDLDHHQLMDEMDELLQTILHVSPADRFSYQQLFQQHLHIDPLTASMDELAVCAKNHGIELAATIDDKDTWLNLLMSHCIEPQLGQQQAVFVYDFPASQAALARLSPADPRVASRFEVYFKGMELANGFHELQSASEQRKRFEHNLQRRSAMKLCELPIDDYFLGALEHGLPDCAGVALGVDRLVMLALSATCIQDILSFDFNRT